MDCKIVNVTLSRTLVTFTMSKEKKKRGRTLETGDRKRVPAGKRPAPLPSRGSSDVRMAWTSLRKVYKPYSTAHVLTKNGKRALGMGH